VTLKFILPEEVTEILSKLTGSGFQAFLVGGCVRDLILNRPIDDWDFTTNAEPEQISRLFPDSYYDNKFGTVGIPIKKIVGEKEQISVYEITTFRHESGYSDHRHPDKIIWGKTLAEDLERRDFTINSIAYDGKKIIDLFEGQKDLKNKIIRAVGNPLLRFQEDALRMIRAIRISSQLQFTIDNDTFNAIKQNAHLLSKISVERIRDELLNILAVPYPADGILLLRNAGLLPYILPELGDCFGVEQKSPKRHHKYDVGTHLIFSLKNCPSTDPIVRLATLLHDAGKPATFHITPEGVITFYNHEIIGASIIRHFANRLHFSKKDSERLLKLVRFHQFTVDERQTDSAIRRFIKNVGKENLTDILSLRIGDRLGGGATESSWRLELFKKRLAEVQKQPFTVADLKADGYDVMKIYNIGPGRLVGAVLNMLFNDVVEGKLKNEREVLLKRIEKLKKESKIK